MKKLFAVTVVALSIVAGVAAAGTYSTSFPATENPISEAGKWTSGGAGLDWSNVRTTPGLAFGTQGINGGFNDSIAVLGGSWQADQSAVATVHTVNQPTDPNTFEEVEILLRFAITAHNARGYEINFSCKASGAYTQIVRWNGALGSFTILDSRTVSPLANGAQVKATIVGNVITTFINNVAIFSVTDATFPTGNPGIGFYLQGGTPALNSDFGLSTYAATGSLAAVPSAPTNLRIVGE